MTKLEPPILNPRPIIVDDDQTGHTGFGRIWDQPDIRRNPKFWLKLYLEGLTLHRRSLALAGRADRILDLGCGGGWFSVELAKRNVDIEVEAVDIDGRLLDWGRYYMDRLRAQSKPIGRVQFSERNVDEFPWQDHEEAFDLVHAGFILSRLKNPFEALTGIYKSLRPGGWLIYHDATDPPSRNLNRLARLEHFFSKWKDQSSDPWWWRRRWERRYRFDKVRAKARSGAPTEEDVLRRLEDLFAIRFQERRRAILDLYLATFTKANSARRTMLIPSVKLCDDILCRSGLLVGATRYVLCQKR